MKLIGDGVVESILKGENVGITPRRRACTSQQNPPVHYSTRTRSNPAHTYLSTSRLTATAIARKSRNRPGIDGIPRDNPPTPLPADKVGSITLLDSSNRSQVERRRKASESDSTLPLTTESRVACRRIVGVNEKLPEENLPRTSKRLVRSRFQKESNLKDEDTDSVEEEEDRRILTRRKRDSPSRNSFCHHDNPDGQDDSRDSDESDVSRRTENSNHCPINSTEKVIRTRRTTRCGRSQETNVDNKEDYCRKTSENSEVFKDSSSRVVISCVPSRTISCSEDSNDPSVLCSTNSPAKSCTWTVPVTAVVSSVSVVLTPLSPSVVSAAVGARDSPVESKASESAEASPHCQAQDSSSRTSSEPSPQSPDKSVPPPLLGLPCNSESSTQCPAPISVCQDASAKGADSPPRPPVSEMSQLDRPDRPVSASFSAVNSGKSSPVPATKQVNNTSDSHSLRGSVPVCEPAPGKSIKDRGSSSEETRKAEDKPCKHPSSLGPERHEPVRVYRDLHLVNNNVRHVDCLHHGLMHPAGLSHGAAAAAAYPRVPSLPQHTRAPGTPLPATHLAPYGLSSHLLSPHVPAATAAAAAGPHLDQHSLHSQAYRHILSQHALLPQYSSPVGLDMLNWTQKYPPHITTPPTPNPWMVAHYQEELRLERERALVQERDRQNRIERERREEQERIEREKAEREKVEKERAERERQEKERQERERQERERLEREERERAQREAVQQHFEESLRFMQKQQKSMGWSPMSTLPLSKSLSSSATVGHNSSAASMSQSSHNQAIHSTDLEQTRDKARDKDVKERFGSVDTSRLRPDHERWITTVVQPRNDSVAALQQSLSQNISPSEARPGSGQSKPDGYSIARSSPHSTTNISGHSTSKSGIAPSPVPSVHSSSAAAVQHKQEPSFSLYGYQPFQHTYITQAQLKAREENKGSSSLQQVIAPSGRQPNIKQEKEASIPFDRPTTPSSSRTGNSNSQATLLSTKQQLKIMHPQSQDRTSPMYQPLVGGGGAFKPYEYSSHSPAPAHQNTSSPTLTGRMGGSSYHPSHQEQPQNLVKGDSKGTVHDHSTSQSQTHHKYDSSRPPVSTPPTAVPASYTPPYTGSKNASPVTSATYSYSLIQQGLVPNPLYTPAHSGASTTSVATVTTATPSSPQAPSKPPSQAGSPPMVQQYPRATPGTGITSGTPICRSSSVPYPIHQSRNAHSYSPGGPASTPGMTPNRTSTPQEAHSGSRSHISTPGANHRSPSPAHLYGVSPGSLPQPNTPTPPLHVSRAPPSTSPRISTTPNPPHISRVPLHPGNSPLPTISPPQPSSTPDNQPQPLNLQNSGSLVKRKTSKDGNGRKRQRTNEEHLLPPQLQPQVVHPDSSPPVSQLGTPPQLVSNTSISIGTPFSNSATSSTSSSNNNSASHSQTQPGTPVGHSPQAFSASDSPSATTPSETSTQASGISSSSHGSGFMESFCSFVSSAQQDQYQTYYNKHAKGRNKITPEHSTSTPAEITDTFVRPSSNSNSSATSLQSAGGGSQEASEESRVSSSPASNTSTSLSTTNAASTGGSSNHTKLKKAWLQRHSENEDKKNPSDSSKHETPAKSSVSEPTSLSSETKSVITSSSSTVKSSSTTTTVSSREGRTNSSSSSNEGNSVNGLGGKNTPAEAPAEDDSTSSASETEQELKNLKRKTRVSRKGVSSVTNSANSTTSTTSSKRQKLSSESQNDSLEEMPNIKKETNKRKCVLPERETTNNSRRRGRKTKGRCAVPEESQKKKSPKPPEKPSVARLKRTGEPFLQDGPCCEVAPKLPKCRECRMTPHQRSKKMPNIFCRFYAYRKLRYGKNGTILGAGFSEPSDAAESDLRLWLPPLDSPPSDMEMETSKFLLTHVGDQFCDLVEQEREAQSLHMSEDKTVTWKRVVQGVREMCDVCETTLFNFHWVCHKCGFVVCIDCYKARKNGTVKEDQSPPKDRDEYQWLLCSNRQHHEQEKLMMTQIIAGSALWDVGKLLHEVRRKWNIPAYCNCSNKDSDSDNKHSANGICKQLMNAVTKCFSSDKDPLQVNGISDCPRLTRKSGKSSVNGVIKQEDGLSGYSSESGGSPLSWLADVALNSSGKLKEDRKKSKLKTDDDDDDDTKDDKNSENQLDGTDGLGDSDDERSENFSTLRELLIRPTGKLGGKSSGTNSNSQKTLTSTLDEVISCVIEQRVRKSDKKSKDEKQLVHFTRRYHQSRSGRELLPIRACALAESTLLYPDIPHTWLCSGILLHLKDPSHSGNLQLFQEQWKRGQPVLVADVNKKLDSSLWHPDSFIRDFGDIKNDLVNCKTGTVLPNLPMRKFWEGFENVNKRLKDDDGESMLLKLKDWPPGEEFSELLPARYQDLMKSLPLSQYTSRSGCFNLASCLPDCFVRPDLGPKMHNAYGSPFLSAKGTTNLHLEISDSVNVMVYVGIPKDSKDDSHIQEALRLIDEGGCDSAMKRRSREKGNKPGALWHIYHARDADKIRDLLNKVAEEKGRKMEPHHDSIHSQEWYMDEELRNRLYKEYGVEGYAVVQCMGDSLFIPAGAPHQVCNLHSCIKVVEDFVSPENVGKSFALTQEFRHLSDTNTNNEDKLQIKNIIYHAVKDVLALLESSEPEDCKT